MRITALPLNAISHVKHHAHPLALDHSGHKLYQSFDYVHIPFSDLDIMPTLFEGVCHLFNSLWVVYLLVLHSKPVDHASQVFIIDYSYFRRTLTPLKEFIRDPYSKIRLYPANNLIIQIRHDVPRL